MTTAIKTATESKLNAGDNVKRYCVKRGWMFGKVLETTLDTDGEPLWRANVKWLRHDEPELLPQFCLEAYPGEPSEIIEQIVTAAARPCPNIVEARRAKNIHTGAICSLFGMPFGFRNEDYVTVTVGFVYRSNDGTTYGTVYQSRAEAESAHANRAETVANDFRAKLKAMTYTELTAQAEYWLKG